MATRKFHYKDAKSDKFWTITLTGNKYTIHFGKTGTKGQEQTKNFPSEELAKKAYEKIIREKTGKGYKEITDKKEKEKPEGLQVFQDKKDYFINELKHGDSKVRSRGAWYLGDKKYFHGHTLESLKNALKDKEPPVRYCAAKSLGILCEKERVPVEIIDSLQELRKDEFPFVGAMAEEALRKMGDEEIREEIARKYLEELPSSLKELLPGESGRFIEEIASLLPKEKKLKLLKILYDIDNEQTEKALRNLLLTLNLPSYWDQFKAIYKKAEYRMDAEILGLIAYRIETTPHQGIITSYGSWFEYDEVKMRNVKSYFSDTQKIEKLINIPQNRLISREEVTGILSEMGLEDQEIRQILWYGIYYGNTYGIDSKTIENMGELITLTASLTEEGKTRSLEEFTDLLTSMKFKNNEIEIIKNFAFKGYNSGTFYQVNDWSERNVAYYVPKVKAEKFKIIPKRKLMSKEEAEQALSELDFNESEIQKSLNCIRYYGNLYHLDAETIESLKRIVEERKLEPLAAKCTKSMSQKEFDDLLKDFAFNENERKIIINITSRGYAKHTTAYYNRFVRHTRLYMMRRIWRYFKNLAKNRPDDYSEFAYFFLKNFTDKDWKEVQEKVTSRYDWKSKKTSFTKKYYGGFTYLWSFNHILFGSSKRYVCNKKSYNWYCSGSQTPEKFFSPEDREEAFPDLWEKNSGLLVNLLLESECFEVSSFAIKVLRDKFPEVLKKNLFPENIKKILQKNYPLVISTVLKILDDNFDPANPDLEVIKILLECENISVREIAGKWLERIPLIPEKKKIVKFLLQTPYSDNWSRGMKLASGFCKKDPALTGDYLELFISLILVPEEKEGLHNIIIEFLKSEFSRELESLPADRIFSILNSSSRKAQDLGGWLLSKSLIDPHILDKHVIIGFANHEVFSVREAGRKMMEETRTDWKEDMFRILSLLESHWEDTKKFAFRFLEENFALEDFTAGIILSLCDSIDREVQDFAKKLLNRHVTAGKEFDFVKLAEHPDMNIQAFVLDMIIEKLPCSVENIKKVLPYFKTILFYVNRGRKMKDRVLSYLEEMSLKDPFVAAEAVNLMEDYTGAMTKEDFSSCLVIMSRLKAKYPYITCPVEILA